MSCKTCRILSSTITFVGISFCRIYGCGTSGGLKPAERVQHALLQQRRHRGNADASAVLKQRPPPPRTKYYYMRAKFESLAPVSDMDPGDIAAKYGIPLTPRENATCSANTTTTIGWIPADPTARAEALSGPKQFIPRLIFQSWMTNDVEGPICENAVSWSRLNPEYDYFLFDDASVDSFILLEYGREVFEEYSCINVGAGKCDVWRLLVLYLFGGAYFDLDVWPKVRFAEWRFGNHTVVTGAPLPRFGKGAHQWGMIYTPRHPVIRDSILTVLENLWQRTAVHVKEIGFYAFRNAWTDGPYKRSHMPGWGPRMGGRVVFQQEQAKAAMEKEGTHWRAEKNIWIKECTIRAEPG